MLSVFKEFHGRAEKGIWTDESEREDKMEEETESEPVVKERRYPCKQRKASSRYSTSQYVLLTDEGEPECYEKTMTYVNKEKWYNANARTKRIPCMRTTPTS